MRELPLYSRKANRLFLLLGVLTCVAFWTPIRALIALSVGDERYAYILAIPFISAGLFYAEKKYRVQDLGHSPKIGVSLILLGLGTLKGCKMFLSMPDNLTLETCALVLVGLGSYICCYGMRSFGYHRFPLLLLCFVVPIPNVVLDKFTTVLQIGSAELSYRLFQLVGVPVLRHGTVMSLPSADIEVAYQCSGIRSTMALFLSSIVFSRLLLRSGWGRLLVILCVGPIGIFRNAVRIVAITLLGVYVDKDFFFGDLHRRGGLLFSLVGFAVLIPLVWLIRTWERRARAVPSDATGVRPG